MNKKILSLNKKEFQTIINNSNSFRNLESKTKLTFKKEDRDYIKNNFNTNHFTKSIPNKTSYINIIGKKFGKLKVIEIYKDYESKNKIKLIYWTKCICECGKEKNTRLSNLIHGRCKSCGCIQTGSKSGKDHKSWTGYEGISGGFYHKIKRKAEIRKIHFDVSIEYLWNLFIKQNGKCYYCNKKIILSNKTSEKTASLDRIDSSKGYIEGNVQWVRKDINIMKNIYSHSHFVNTCKEIAENCR
jgi:hypothetical protein